MDKLIRLRFYKDWLFKGGIVLLTILSTVPLLLILFYIIKQGISSINWDFFINLPKPVGEKGGGIINALIGSGIIVFFASLMAIPFGAFVGLYLSEYNRDKLAYWVGLSVDVLQGIPSIVLGIIIYLWVVKPTGHFSALSGSIALAIMMLPPIIKIYGRDTETYSGYYKRSFAGSWRSLLQNHLTYNIANGFEWHFKW